MKELDDLKEALCALEAAECSLGEWCNVQLLTIIDRAKAALITMQEKIKILEMENDLANGTFEEIKKLCENAGVDMSSTPPMWYPEAIVHAWQNKKEELEGKPAPINNSVISGMTFIGHRPFLGYQDELYGPFGQLNVPANKFLENSEENVNNICSGVCTFIPHPKGNDYVPRQHLDIEVPIEEVKKRYKKEFNKLTKKKRKPKKNGR